MVLVAVAGGTSPTLGRSIVTALLAAGYEVIILSRMPSDQSTAPQAAHGAPIRYVAYVDFDSLKIVLQGVQSVISVLKIPSEELMTRTHLNLLRASLATGTVKRFIPSDFSMYALSHTQVSLLAHKSSLLRQCQELASSQGTTDLEIGQFKNGMFMNYFGQLSPQAQSSPAVLAGLDDDLMLDYIDISKGVLLIPTTPDGQSARISMTHIDDIGKYVVAAVSLPLGKWPKSGILTIASATTTFTHVSEILEKECGLKITHNTVTVEDCDRKKAEFDRVLQENGFDMAVFKGGMVAEMERVACLGEQGGTWEENELGKLCAEVRTGGVREYLVEAWGRKD